MAKLYISQELLLFKSIAFWPRFKRRLTRFSVPLDLKPQSLYLRAGLG